MNVKNFLSSSWWLATKLLSHQKGQRYNHESPPDIIVATISQCCAPDWVTWFLMVSVVILFAAFARSYSLAKVLNICPLLDQPMDLGRGWQN